MTLNMKRFMYLSLIGLVAVGLTFSSCKKKDKEEDDDTADQIEAAQDESTIHTESEAAFNDANTSLGASGLNKSNLIAGATIDSGSIAQKKLFIHYNGNNFDNSRFRSGYVQVQLTNGAKWRDAGAVITITFTNFKVTKNPNGKSVTINGSITVTNETGGKVFEDANVIHHVAGSLAFTFDNGTSRTWNIARKRTFANAAGVLKVTTEGEGSQEGLNNLLVWGTTRKGQTFYTQ